jgi:cell division protein FtsQ
MTNTLLRPNGAGPTRRPRRAWRTRIVAAVLILLAAIVISVLEFTPVVGVRTVKVTGTRQLSQHQVIDAAAIKRGTPLLRVNKASIRARIAAIPDVLSVKVDTSLPSTVTLEVTERVAVAFRTEGDRFRLLDGNDVGFRLVSVAPKALPRLDVADNSSNQQSAAAAVAGSLPASVAKLVQTISAPTSESITLSLADGRVVLWGGTDRNQDKARLLPVLLRQPGRYFDLSDPDVVISRPSAS